MGAVNYLDTILVPLSLFLTVGYHVFLWHNFKHNPSIIIVGINTLKRRQWLQGIKLGDDKKEILAVQSLRNALMETILTATITMLITMALAALANNAYKGSNLMAETPFFGSQSGRIIVLKFGSVLVFLLTSFLCSSIAIGYLVDSNFLINATGELLGRAYTRIVLERGFIMGVVGSRMLCISLTLLLWLFGPVPVVVSSVVMLWVLYGLDYADKAHYITK
ncbi:uncharacterized protein LOC141646057 [Silene latifolia]|uniref:uncharacterized protein LOC141646057 n=1 Tax=Silene latifolia TaxID=37657 RepID=UPI003D76F834